MNVNEIIKTILKPEDKKGIKGYNMKLNKEQINELRKRNYIIVPVNLDTDEYFINWNPKAYKYYPDLGIEVCENIEKNKSKFKPVHNSETLEYWKNGYPKLYGKHESIDTVFAILIKTEFQNREKTGDSLDSLDSDSIAESVACGYELYKELKDRDLLEFFENDELYDGCNCYGYLKYFENVRRYLETIKINRKKRPRN